MLKKSILTPVLSGVLAVTVVGSGAYYFMNQKNVDKDDDESSSQSQKDDSSKKESGSDDSISIDVEDKELQAGLDKATDKFDEVKTGVADQVDTMSKALTGDLDFAYNASFTITPGEMLTEQEGFPALKSFGLDASAKQKGDMSQFTIAGVYDGKTLASANIVGDRNGGNVYAQVPELSSTYVSVSAEQLKAQLEKAVTAPVEAYTRRSAQIAQAQDEDTMPNPDAQTAEMPDFNELIAVFDSIDEEALATDIEEYLQVIADNFPEGKDAEATKGTVDGVSYELATKTYDVTEADAIKISKALAEKAKDDSIIKDFLDNETVKQMTQSNGSADFVASMDELIKSLDEQEADGGEAVSFDVMFDADGAIAGFKMDVDNEGFYGVITTVGDDLVVDVKFDGGDDFTMTATGVIKNENGTQNGSIKVDSSSKNSDSGKSNNFSMVYTLKDVKTVDDVMSGTVSIEATAGEQTVGLVFTSNSTKDKTDLVFSSTLDGKSIFDIAFTLEQTDASDITVPTDAIAIDLETGDGADKYAATLDLEGFEAHIKDVLGEELFNSIMGSSRQAIDDVQTITDQTTAPKVVEGKKN